LSCQTPDVLHLDQSRTTAAVEAQFEAFESLAASLAPAQWHLPTALPGWDVQANVAHVIGIEAMLLGEPAPPVEVDRSARPHVRNDFGAFNEAWVVSLAAASPHDVLDELRQRLGRRREALAALSADDWDAEAATPAGLDTYGRFMRIRIMDIWMHEQDIREAVGRPGHLDGPCAELALDEMTSALGFVVGKRAGAPDGSSVTFDLQGPAARQVHVAVHGRAALVDSLPGPADVVLAMPALTFTRLAGGRSTDTSGVAIAGDEALGQQVLTNLGYMI
jgi:uncharacterized protein (TIGR03083 family)